MKEIKRKARKNYECDICKRTVFAGQSYLYILTEKSDWEDPWDIEDVEVQHTRQEYHRHIDCNEQWKEILDMNVEIIDQFSLCYCFDSIPVWQGIQRALGECELDSSLFYGEQKKLFRKSYVDWKKTVKLIKRWEILGGKRIKNPVTGKYYQVRQKATSSGTKGQIKGLWKAQKKKSKKRYW